VLTPITDFYLKSCGIHPAMGKSKICAFGITVLLAASPTILHAQSPSPKDSLERKSGESTGDYVKRLSAEAHKIIGVRPYAPPRKTSTPKTEAVGQRSSVTGDAENLEQQLTELVKARRYSEAVSVGQRIM